MKKISIDLEIWQAERIRDMLYGLAPSASLGKTDHELYALFRDAIAKNQEPHP